LNRERYNWKTSRSAYEIFVFIYLRNNKGTTLSDLMDSFQLASSTLSEQVTGLKKAGLIREIKSGRGKIFWPDLMALFKKTGCESTSEFNSLFPLSRTFERLIKSVKEGV